MNDFERELRKILDDNTHFTDLAYVGRTCYGTVNDSVRASFDFSELAVKDHFTALKVTLINRHQGVIDFQIIRFAELLGKKQVSNRNFPYGVHPYLWLSNGKLDWYVYKPNEKDFSKIATAVNKYLSAFESEYGREQ